MKMRIAVMAIMIVLLFSFCASALADKQQRTAFITSDTSDRVHLRARPSKSADSLGLYFEGTPVIYTGSLDDTWVAVQIGSEQGYMMSAYLTSELTEVYALSEMKTGVVRVSSSLNLRTAPSTKAQSLMRLQAGEQVIILGETNTHWYYVSYDGMAGYAKAEYIERKSQTQVRTSITEDIINVLNGERTFWFTDANEYMYIQDIGEHYFSGTSVEFPRFTIADVDHDTEDELILVQNVGKNEYYGFLILKNVDGNVWGYEAFFRAMSGLKADGTFSFSAGALDNGFGYMNLDGDLRQLVCIAESVSHEDSIDYYMCGQKVSEKLFRDTVEWHDQKPDAIWYDVTNKNLSVLRRMLTE